MPTNWPTLLSSIGIEWRTHGPNTSRGNVTIRCCWCGESDRSGHLKISLNDDGYYCLRNPHHRGRNMIYLLTTLGLPRQQALGLYNLYTTSVAKIPEDDKTQKRRILRRDEWARFRNAHDSDWYLTYLEKRRGFPDPESVAKRFDLRYAVDGKWANRVLIPLPDHDDVESWSGRTTVDSLSPKYLMRDNSGSLLYIPKPVARTTLLVEGPMDALKIAVASDYNVSAIAVLGKDMNIDRQAMLSDVMQSCEYAVVVLDADTRRTEANAIVAALRPLLPRCVVTSTVVPSYAKDAGEMTIPQLHDFLGQIATSA